MLQELLLAGTWLGGTGEVPGVGLVTSGSPGPMQGPEGNRWEQRCHEVVPVQVTSSLPPALPPDAGFLLSKLQRCANSASIP